MSRLIIQGAIYYSPSQDTILRAQRSGEFYVVECAEFKRKGDIKAQYGETVAQGFLKESPLLRDGKKYYPCNANPYQTEELELLSDIDFSEFKYVEDQTEF